MSAENLRERALIASEAYEITEKYRKKLVQQAAEAIAESKQRECRERLARMIKVILGVDIDPDSILHDSQRWGQPYAVLDEFRWTTGAEYELYCFYPCGRCHDPWGVSWSIKRLAQYGDVIKHLEGHAPICLRCDQPDRLDFQLDIKRS